MTNALTWRRRRGSRFLLHVCAAFASATCVASLGAVGLLDRSVAHAVDSGIGAVDGVDLAVFGVGREPFTDALFPKIEATPGVATAAPVVRTTANLGGSSVAVVGLDERYGRIDTKAGAALSAVVHSDRVRFDRLWVPRALGPRAGDRLSLLIGGRASHVVVGGTFDPVGAAGVAGRDTLVGGVPFVQALAGRGAVLDAVLIRAEQDADLDALRARLSSTLTPSVSVERLDLLGDQLAAVAKPVRDALLLIVVLAAFVSITVMFQIATLAAVERSPDIGVLRLLGAGRSRAVVWFARPLLATTALGVGAGALGAEAIARYQVDHLPSSYVDTLALRVPYAASPAPLVVAAAIGVLAAAVGSASAMWSVSRVAPVQAVVPVRDREARRVPSVAFGVLTLGLLLAAAATAGVGGSIAGPVAVVMVGFAAASGATALATPLVRLLAGIIRLGGSTAELVSLGLKHAPGRLVATITAMAIAVGSFVAVEGIAHDTARAVEADHGRFRRPRAVAVAGAGLGFSSTQRFPGVVAAQLGAVQGVSAVARTASTLVDVGGTQAVLNGVEEGGTEVFDHLGRTARERFLSGEGVAITVPLASRMGVRVGHELAVPTATGVRRLLVIAVIPALSWQGGTISARYDDVERWMRFSGPSAVELLTSAAEEGHVTQRARGVLARAGVDGVVRSSAEIRATVSQVTQQGYAVFRGLRLAIALAALTALPAAVSITAVERRRSLATLRAMGATRARIAAVVAGEATVAAALGLFFGVVAGLGMHRIVLRSLSTTTGLPIGFSLDVGATAPAVAVIGALSACVAIAPAVLAANRSILAGVETE